MGERANQRTEGKCPTCLCVLGVPPNEKGAQTWFCRLWGATSYPLLNRMIGEKNGASTFYPCLTIPVDFHGNYSKRRRFPKQSNQEARQAAGLLFAGLRILVDFSRKEKAPAFWYVNCKRLPPPTSEPVLWLFQQPPFSTPLKVVGDRLLKLDAQPWSVVTRCFLPKRGLVIVVCLTATCY